MTLRFAVVYEAEADFQTATELADRVLVAKIDWLDDDLLAGQREWVAYTSASHPLTWKSIPQLAREADIRAHGHFDGEPGFPDAAAARRAIRFLLRDVLDLGAVVLIRDQDGQPERRQGLEQARKENHGLSAVVVGLAVVERECWVVGGFDPLDDDEKARLESLKKELNFDPCRCSHLLTACKNDSAPHSPKKALRTLSGDDRERERRCWMETPLEVLRERGMENGLADFLDEVGERLAPIIGYVEG